MSRSHLVSHVPRRHLLRENLLGLALLLSDVLKNDECGWTTKLHASAAVICGVACAAKDDEPPDFTGRHGS